MTTYDQKIDKYFYYWLLISFFIVFSMVIVGGLTRLTNSGLSITEWELFKGLFPPLNSNAWDDYFNLYKEIPQYKLLYPDMTMNEFKFIFYWEYSHRVLGRILGLFFLLPYIYFFFIKKVKKKFLPICTIILLLIIFQGLIGWYMVKSGLVNDVTVSHYRLSIHLGVAFIIISITFLTLLNLKNNNNNIFTITKSDYLFFLLILLIFVQIILGAFVSGLDAGQVYQSWPLMNDSYFPDDINISLLKEFFDFNDHGLVQFYHRNIAYLIVLYILLLGFYIMKNKLKKLFKPFYILAFFLILQIFLGIITLLSGINILLASSHQICSLLLILSTLNLYYRYKIN